VGINLSLKVDLKLDWCSYQAAKYAVKHWHYSRSLSSGRNVYLGIWENSEFIGSIVFGIGSGNATNGIRYGLARNCEMAELTRVALKEKHCSSVSRIVAIGLRMLRKQSPGIRLVISMADPQQGHIGAIYQAGNWIYTGRTKPDVMYLHRGKWVHHRTATSAGSAAGLPSKPVPPKYRYLMPLDDDMRQQIISLAKPYPKRGRSDTIDTAPVQGAEGGVIPTLPLQHG
jgi:hypothetical protein